MQTTEEIIANKFKFLNVFIHFHFRTWAFKIVQLCLIIYIIYCLYFIVTENETFLWFTMKNTKRYCGKKSFYSFYWQQWSKSCLKFTIIQKRNVQCTCIAKISYTSNLCPRIEEFYIVIHSQLKIIS